MTKEIRKRTTQKYLEVNKTTTKIENSTDQFNSRLETDEKRIHERKEELLRMLQRAYKKIRNTNKKLRDRERGGLKEIRNIMCSRITLGTC